MSGGLRDLLMLPEASRAEMPTQAEEFGRAFREGMAELNRNLQVVAAQAGSAEHQPLEAQRARLYEAFQKASAQIDPGDPARGDQAIQRVMAAVMAVQERASAIAEGAAAGRDQWLAREGEFDDSVERIGELEQAGHPKAATLRKLGEAIRKRVNDRKYEESVAALHQLRPRLDQIYALFRQQAVGDAEMAGADRQSPTDEPASDQPTAPAGVTDVQTSCIVTVRNNTNAVLTLKEQSHQRGDFMTFPDTTLSPGASTEFVSVETPDSTSEGCQGFMQWDVDGGPILWQLQWDNPEQKKNTTRSTIFGDQEDFYRDLDQIGQGDENVPTVFTLSQSGAPGETPPGTQPPETITEATVPITVTDRETDEPIADATVEIAGQLTNTDDAGRVELTAPVGPQAYQASATNYDSATGTVDVVEGENPVLQIALTAEGAGAVPREGLTVLITDAETGEVIEGAEVTVGDQSDTSSANGLSTVELPVGAHSYEASAENYDPESGEVEIIEGDNPELVIEMTPGTGAREGLTILVKDAETGEVIEGADVTVGDQSDVTSSNGLATVELPVGTHRFDASDENYDPESGEVEIIRGDNPELVIELTPNPVEPQTLTVLVRDKETQEAVPNADVTIGGQSKTTSENGLATFELPAGTHDYEADAEEYNKESGSVEIVEGDNEELVIELTKKGPCVHATLAVVVVDDDTTEGIPGATVTVGDKTEAASAVGVAVLTMDPGTYDYEVSADDAGYLPDSGSVEV